jgi:hypothetical protein
VIRPIHDVEAPAPNLPKIVAVIFSPTGLLSKTDRFE